MSRISHKAEVRIGIMLDRGLLKAVDQVCERRPLSFHPLRIRVWKLI
ncbi:MAG: hypothetical protein ACXQTF_00025 [Candidatus Hecatellaceae archaeon]